jgi:Zn finger protein HypA/HybF involved in hydrogenase expression
MDQADTRPRRKEKWMKKLIATGTVAAALLFAVSSPALAQDAVAVDDSVATGGDVQFVDASQFQFALQAQFGDAVADDESIALVTSDQSITQSQANAGLGEGGNIFD